MTTQVFFYGKLARRHRFQSEYAGTSFLGCSLSPTPPSANLDGRGLVDAIARGGGGLLVELTGPNRVSMNASSVAFPGARSAKSLMTVRAVPGEGFEPSHGMLRFNQRGQWAFEPLPRNSGAELDKEDRVLIPVTAADEHDLTRLVEHLGNLPEDRALSILNVLCRPQFELRLAHVEEQTSELRRVVEARGADPGPFAAPARRTPPDEANVDQPTSPRQGGWRGWAGLLNLAATIVVLLAVVIGGSSSEAASGAGAAPPAPSATPSEAARPQAATASATAGAEGPAPQVDLTQRNLEKLAAPIQALRDALERSGVGEISGLLKEFDQNRPASIQKVKLTDFQKLAVYLVQHLSPDLAAKKGTDHWDPQYNRELDEALPLYTEVVVQMSCWISASKECVDAEVTAAALRDLTDRVLGLRGKAGPSPPGARSAKSGDLSPAQPKPPPTAPSTGAPAPGTP